MIAAIFLLALACLESSPQTRPKSTIAMYAVPRAADLVTTEIALSRGLGEANPLMQRCAVRIAYSTALVAGFACWDLQAQKRGAESKRKRHVVRAVYLGIHAFVVGSNVRLLLRDRKRR